ncbi:MAG: hypothetical protein QOJ35_2979 [Solirubrobacteraceae bacterium]|jgi:hypothetical protein|nr:hypothetical protein [Solirubrobacteraceae bacterium]
MRSRRRAPIIGAVPAKATRVRIVVLVDLDSDPIEGSLQTADGTSRDFSGWIGLAAALHAIRDAEAGAAPRRDDRAHEDT